MRGRGEGEGEREDRGSRRLRATVADHEKVFGSKSGLVPLDLEPLSFEQ